MFSNTKITSIPNIKAVEVTNKACFGMFSGCTSLTSVTMSLVRTISTSGMSQMFVGCTGLLDAKIGSWDYYNMGSITTEGCAEMFSGCSSMNLITLYVSPHPGENPYPTDHWVIGVERSGGVLRCYDEIKNNYFNTMTDQVSNRSGIPYYQDGGTWKAWTVDTNPS